MKNIIPILTLVLLFATACKSDTNEAISFTRIDGKRVPILNLENINSDPVEVGISQLISDYKVIELETKEECMIEYAHPYYTKDKLLISTQHFPGPAPLYMFNMEGKFLREVGRGGQGPGEHSGYVVENVIADPDFGTIFVNFQNVLQLFDAEGNFIRRVKQPRDFRENAYRLDQDTWFSPGMAADYALRANDSVLIVFYDESGSVIAKTERDIYPPESKSGYTPSGWDRTIYKYNDNWRIYLPGTDTLYRLDGMKMIPEMIFNTGEHGMKYNRIMTQDEVIGSFDLSVIAETDNYYLIRMGTIIEAEIVEYREGVCGEE